MVEEVKVFQKTFSSATQEDTLQIRYLGNSKFIRIFKNKIHTNSNLFYSKYYLMYKVSVVLFQYKER